MCFKELCLYLDEERNQSAVCPNCGNGLRPGPRDDGDGSSSSTNADEPALPAQFSATNPRRTESRERLLEESIQRQRTVFNGNIFNSSSSNLMSPVFRWASMTPYLLENITPPPPCSKFLLL